MSSLVLWLPRSLATFVGSTFLVCVVLSSAGLTIVYQHLRNELLEREPSNQYTNPAHVLQHKYRRDRRKGFEAVPGGPLCVRYIPGDLYF
jgi:hypothetical protein